MANNWPDGEQPLTKTEKWMVGIFAVLMIAGSLIYLALICLSALHLRLPPAGLVGLGAVILALATAWVCPWHQEPPKPPRRTVRLPRS